MSLNKDVCRIVGHDTSLMNKKCARCGEWEGASKFPRLRILWHRVTPARHVGLLFMVEPRWPIIYCHWMNDVNELYPTLAQTPSWSLDICVEYYKAGPRTGGDVINPPLWDVSWNSK